MPENKTYIAFFAYPFGMGIKNREYVAFKDFRYGFGSQEKDDEIYGKGNSTTAEYWQYDSRLGRRWNIDPLSYFYPWQSPYASFNNNPIYFTDPFGLEGDDKKQEPKRVWISSEEYAKQTNDGKVLTKGNRTYGNSPTKAGKDNFYYDETPNAPSNNQGPVPTTASTPTPTLPPNTDDDGDDGKKNAPPTAGTPNPPSRETPPSKPSGGNPPSGGTTLPPRTGLPNRPVITPPCKPFKIPLSFDWQPRKAIPVNMDAAVLQIWRACSSWTSCNTKIQVNIVTQWPYESAFEKNILWGMKTPYQVTQERANFIHGIIRDNPKTKSAIILNPMLQFDIKQIQHADIKFY